MVNERLENGVKLIRLNTWADGVWGSEFHCHFGSSLKMLNSPTSEDTSTVDLGFFLVWTKENSIKYKNSNDYNRKESIKKGAELRTPPFGNCQENRVKARKENKNFKSKKIKRTGFIKEERNKERSYRIIIFSH